MRLGAFEPPLLPSWSSRSTDDGAVPLGVLDSFYTFWAKLSNFNLSFLLLTHAFATLYVGFNTFIASKVILMTLGAIQVITFFQMIYHGSNPFWFEGIFASSCKQSYSHPDLPAILLILVPTYLYYCWIKQNSEKQRLKGSIFGYLSIDK